MSDPPTERQINYAKDLGIQIPANATKVDLSDLISMKVEGDKPSADRHRKFAEHFQIEVGRHIGKKALFERIQYALSNRDRPDDLMAWFTYRVYRHLTSADDRAPIQGPEHPDIKQIASALVNDESVVRSAKRYDGEDLIFFGEFVSANGTAFEGGSTRTKAFKAAATALKEAELVPKRSPPTVRYSKEATQSAEPQGCLTSLAFVFVSTAALLWGFA